MFKWVSSWEFNYESDREKEKERVWGKNWIVAYWYWNKTGEEIREFINKNSREKEREK